jgi:hypothetical protein
VHLYYLNFVFAGNVEEQEEGPILSVYNCVAEPLWMLLCIIQRRENAFPTVPFD